MLIADLTGTTAANHSPPQGGADSLFTINHGLLLKYILLNTPALRYAFGVT
jgi:hypothetical protein